jgi:hypothetical protein
MVRLAGIEPTTPWFVAKYSIQLSYSREASHYISAGRDSVDTCRCTFALPGALRIAFLLRQLRQRTPSAAAGLRA